jgi:hypothetical protein
MALFQTALAAGRESSHNAYASGVVINSTARHTFTAAFTAASDKIELGLLPAGARPTRVQVLGEGVGAINVTVGFMSGEPGVVDDARTVGSQFINAASVNDTVASAALSALLAITPAETHRAIGATLSGNVGANASRRLTLVMDYTY